MFDDYDIYQNETYISLVENKKLLRKLRNDDKPDSDLITVTKLKIKELGKQVIEICANYKSEICRMQYNGLTRVLYARANDVQTSLMKPIRPLMGYEM